MHLVRGTEEYTVAEGHEWFWWTFEDGSWEPSTLRIFDKFLKPDGVMLDIGAWIGPTALYAARRTKKVFAFEPDPVAYRLLVQNIELNKADNVTPYPVAVSNEFKGIPFGTKTGYGDSMSSQIWAKDDAMVPAIALSGLIIDTSADFIKIDIEGGEKFLFDEGSKTVFESYQPTIHLSLHTPDMKNDLLAFKKAIIEGVGFYPFFYDENFQRIELERAFDISAFNSVIATYNEIV